MIILQIRRPLGLLSFVWLRSGPLIRIDLGNPMAVPVILVVDDEASIRRTLREILEYEDFAVEEAEDGEAALDKLRSAAV